MNEEENDYTSVYLKGVYDERDKWKDKIRKKIREILEKGEKITEEERQKETQFNQGKLRAFEELLEE